MGYDLFDINSPFYQDICIPYTSNDGTDVLLKDRINYYYNNKETVCQYNWQFSNYIIDTQYLKCDCDINNSEINTQEITKFNAKTIYQSFYSVLKYSNYKVLSCYLLIFSFNSFTSNIGSILSIIFFFIFFILFIIYIIKGSNQLKTNISIAFNKNIQNNKIYMGQIENKENTKVNDKKILKDEIKQVNNTKYLDKKAKIKRKVI